tara:strand:- start:1040 stop:1171 length:132 start_codon:yes stop_codon:yes gene_type:complete
MASELVAPLGGKSGLRRIMCLLKKRILNLGMESATENRPLNYL